ncbi:MAG: hypothetical protein ABI663_24020, partial [Chryseolinea sp.]
MMKMLNDRFFLKSIILLLIVVPLAAQSQNFSGYNWYFGDSKTGIRFSRSNNLPSLVQNQAIPFGTGGSAVASDQSNANLLFYTDGRNVFDVTHTLMSNGNISVTTDNTTNQPVAICKVPDQKGLYYIFHRDNTGVVNYSIVDMNQFGNSTFPAPALGAVTVKNIPVPTVPALIGRSEAMITIPHANGNEFWLITHESGTTNYSVTLVQKQVVVGVPIFTTTTISGLGLLDEAANFSYHPTSKRIAVSP